MAFISQHEIHDVTFCGDHIRTTVTKLGCVVEEWIDEVLFIHGNKLQRLFVGLDIEWRPNFNPFEDHHPVAILQLCVGRRCLIFQLLHAAWIPPSLFNFLGNKNFTFAGVGIKDDAEKLLEDYGLWVAHTLDLRSLVASRFNNEDFNRMGLKRLVKEVLGKEMEKPKNITLSRWDARYLSTAQIEYGCIDAFVSFEVALRTFDFSSVLSF